MKKLLVFICLMLVLSVNIQASDEQWRRVEFVDIYPHGKEMSPNMQLPPNNWCPYVYTLYDLEGKSEKIIIKQHKVTFQVIESVIASKNEAMRTMIDMKCTDMRALLQQPPKTYCCFWKR